jgi:hypothetical protein
MQVYIQHQIQNIPCPKAEEDQSMIIIPIQSILSPKSSMIPTVTETEIIRKISSDQCKYS